MIGHSLRPRPSTSGISTSHLRTPSARHPVCPFGRSCSGIVRAFPTLVVTTKLLAYEVCVYLALCPLHACDSSTSNSYCVCGFCFTGDSLTLSDFTACPVELRLVVDPCSRAATVTTLLLFFPTVSHIRGVIGVWLRRGFSSLPLFLT